MRGLGVTNEVVVHVFEMLGGKKELGPVLNHGPKLDPIQGPLNTAKESMGLDGT